MCTQDYLDYSILFKKDSLLFCVNMNRGKLRIFSFGFSSCFAFGDFVNLFAGGSCSYTVDEGAGDGGEAFSFLLSSLFFLQTV